MKKKLTAALCLILCVLFGGGIGYIFGNPECRYQVLNSLPAQWGVEAIKPQLVADEETPFVDAGTGEVIEPLK